MRMGKQNRMLERLIDRFDKKIDGGKGRMKITTTKEFMQVIAKHYEKCKGIYLHAMYNIPFKLIDGETLTLKGLPEDPVERQGVAIMNAIWAAPVLESGETELEVDMDVLQKVYEQFVYLMATEKFIARGYVEWDKDKKDEDGFPAIKIIVPPDKWDMN